MFINTCTERKDWLCHVTQPPTVCVAVLQVLTLFPSAGIVVFRYSSPTVHVLNTSAELVLCLDYVTRLFGLCKCPLPSNGLRLPWQPISLRYYSTTLLVYYICRPCCSRYSLRLHQNLHLLIPRATLPPIRILVLSSGPDIPPSYIPDILSSGPGHPKILSF